MGLMIHSLGELPISAGRGYYVYVLDYGWKGPLSHILADNFEKMADLASKTDAVVLRGTVGSHFVDEVLSWHHVNGEPSKGLLPGLLITTRHPRDFRDRMPGNHHKRVAPEDRMLLVPLGKLCKSASDAIAVIDKIFTDIRERKALPDFEVARMRKKGVDGALVDALILQPNIAGIGIDLKAIFAFFKAK